MEPRSYTSIRHAEGSLLQPHPAAPTDRYGPIPEDRLEINLQTQYPGAPMPLRWQSCSDGINSGGVSLDALFGYLNWRWLTLTPP